MREFASNERRTAEDLVDEMIGTATLELFRGESLALEPTRTVRGSLPEHGALAAHVRFSGAGGAGCLALGCAGSVLPALDVVERLEALGRRIEKRLRQFGIAVRFEAPEPGLVSASDSPFCSTYLFAAGDGEVFVHLEGELDIERIASAGEVPLRDEGDIILF